MHIPRPIPCLAMSPMRKGNPTIPRVRPLHCPSHLRDLVPHLCQHRLRCLVPIPAPAPKNAPPILDASSYAKFSRDIIMTAAMDGQVVLWDCRAASGAGYGVGRLWMGEKTPPWCLSVRHHFPYQMHLVSCDLNFIRRLAGLQMEARSTPADEMAPSTCGMLGNSDDQVPRRYLVF
jgi:hypothetical protein